MRDCPTRGQENRDSQDRGSAGPRAPAASAGRRPSGSAGRGQGRSGASSSGTGSNRTYALPGRHDSDASPDVVTGTMTICSCPAYVLIDPGSTLSYVTPFVARKFNIAP